MLSLHIVYISILSVWTFAVLNIRTTKKRDPESQKVWHDKDPSLFKDQSMRVYFISPSPPMVNDWLMDCCGFYAVSAIFQPCNGGPWYIKTIRTLISTCIKTNILPPLTKPFFKLTCGFAQYPKFPWFRFHKLKTINESFKIYIEKVPVLGWPFE